MTSHLLDHFSQIDMNVQLLSHAGDATPAATRSAQPKVRLRIAAANIPHPDKAHYGGEDAYFISANAIGVADGVGGWQESGINPAEYSSTFMDIAKRYLEGEKFSIKVTDRVNDRKGEESSGENANDDDQLRSSPALSSGEWMDPSPPQPEDPARIASTPSSSRDEEEESIRTALGALSTAHKLTKKPGSATACVIRLDAAKSQIDAANLGDSGFLIIRNGKDIVFQSPSLQHFFDCPFQFGSAPDFTPATDYPEDADVFQLPIESGDVIVLATDGVLDNVWAKDIVMLAPRTADEVDQAAQALASLAARNGADPEYESPYSREASKEGIDIPIWEKISKVSFNNGRLELGRLVGGKLDDVTVVVAVVEGEEKAN